MMKNMLRFSFAGLLLFGLVFAKETPNRIDLCAVDAMDLHYNRNVEISAYVLKSGVKSGVPSPVIKVAERQGNRLRPDGSFFKVDAQSKIYKAKQKGLDFVEIWSTRNQHGYEASVVITLKDGKPDLVKISLKPSGQDQAKVVTCPYPWKE